MLRRLFSRFPWLFPAVPAPCGCQACSSAAVLSRSLSFTSLILSRSPSSSCRQTKSASGEAAPGGAPGLRPHLHQGPERVSAVGLRALRPAPGLGGQPLLEAQQGLSPQPLRVTWEHTHGRGRRSAKAPDVSSRGPARPSPGAESRCAQGPGLFLARLMKTPEWVTLALLAASSTGWERKASSR